MLLPKMSIKVVCSTKAHTAVRLSAHDTASLMYTAVMSLKILFKCEALFTRTSKL